MAHAHQNDDQTEETDFESLYEKYLPLLARIAVYKFQVPPDEAESLAHDVLVHYLRRAPIRDVRPWLIGATCHASRQYWRQNGPTSTGEAEIRLDRVDPTSLRILDSLSDQIAARKALESLPPRCQQILRMRYFEGCTVPEIAARLGVQAKYASKLVTKCLRRGQQVLSADTSEKSGENVDAIDGFVEAYRKLG